VNQSGMAQRQTLAVVALLILIVVLTGLTVGATPRAPIMGALAPFILPSIFTLYFLTILIYGKRIIESLATFFSRKPRADIQQKTGLLSTILSYAIVGVALLILIRIGTVQRFINSLQQNLIFVPSSGLQSGGMPQVTPSSLSPLGIALYYYTAIIFAGVAALSLVLFFGGLQLALRTRKQGVLQDEGEQLREETLQVVRDAVTGLKADGRYQDTILRCYKQMCVILAEHGLGIREDETAREFANSVTGGLGLGGEAVKGLTFLFEEARYSNHQMDDSKRSLALNELDSLERALSANGGAKP
jgi:hypothetical protein